MGAKSENSSTPLPLVALLFSTRTGGLIGICCSVSKQSARRRSADKGQQLSLFVCRWKHRQSSCDTTSVSPCLALCCKDVHLRSQTRTLRVVRSIQEKFKRWPGIEVKCTLFPTILDQFLRKRAPQKYCRKVCVL